MKYKVSGAIAIPKASWGCAPALPNRIQVVFLGENRKESQLPSKSEGCNEIQGFRGNCDSQGKLGMCPSLAEPDSDGISKSKGFSVK